MAGVRDVPTSLHAADWASVDRRRDSSCPKITQIFATWIMRIDLAFGDSANARTQRTKSAAEIAASNPALFCARSQAHQRRYAFGAPPQRDRRSPAFLLLSCRGWLPRVCLRGCRPV